MQGCVVFGVYKKRKRQINKQIEYVFSTLFQSLTWHSVQKISGYNYQTKTETTVSSFKSRVSRHTLQSMASGLQRSS